MKFTFNISLSVLNHLGRNLYRNFITVIGEAISNSWDADAPKVWIEIDRDSRSMFIYDSGTGMTSDEFQNKFLKIGYSKRQKGQTCTPKGRPYIGRKGIGKLALFSCAQKVHIATKTIHTGIVGGLIDNSGLDEAIKDDISANEYALGSFSDIAAEKIASLPSGTALYFEGLNDGVINTIDYLRKIIALNFRFSLLDKSFEIYLNGEPVTVDALQDLADSTQFVWQINHPNDEYLSLKISPAVNKNVKDFKSRTTTMGINGFVASTNKPSDLRIRGANDKVTLDLFVNGRLREKDILKRIPTARIVESYLYGQVHFNGLDYSTDAFTSSREGVINDDPKYNEFLKEFDSIVRGIIDEWDELRRRIGDDGDSDNSAITPRRRKAQELFNATAKEMLPEKKSDTVESWVVELSGESQYNIPSYTECFIAENLLREYIRHKNLPLSPEAQAEAERWKTREQQSKAVANIAYDVRQIKEDMQYLSMDDLSNLIDKPQNQKELGISRDSKVYKPARDAVAHTALITDVAKSQLAVVFENIKARLKQLLDETDK